MADEIAGDVNSMAAELESALEEVESNKPELVDPEPDEQVVEAGSEDEGELTDDQKALKDLEDEEEDYEDEEADDEDDEDASLSLSPTLAEMQKEFPELTKKFPQLKEIIDNERAYGEIFTSPEEAQVLADNGKVLKWLEGRLEAGDVNTLLTGIYKDSEEAGDRFLHNFLPSVRKADTTRYLKIVAPAITEYLAANINEAKRTGNEILLKSAQNMLQYSFDGKPVKFRETDPKALLEQAEKGPSATETKLLDARYQEVLVSTGQKTTKLLTKDISGSLEKFQAFQKLPEFSRKGLVKEIIKEVDSEIRSDPAFGKKLAGLQQQARQNAYAKPYIDKIVKVYLERARVIMPKIRNEHVREAFGIKDNARRPEKKKEVRIPAKAVKAGAPRQKVGEKPRIEGVKDATDFLLN